LADPHLRKKRCHVEEHVECEEVIEGLPGGPGTTIRPGAHPRQKRTCHPVKRREICTEETAINQ